MGSALGPTLVNIFQRHHETNCLKSCPKKFRPKYYKGFVDDIIVLFQKSEPLQQFDAYMNKQHPNIRLSIEAEKMVLSLC